MLQQRQSYDHSDREAKDFVQRLALTCVMQGIVMCGGFCMLKRMLHGSSGTTVKINGRWLSLNGSEASLLECITDAEDIKSGFESVGGLEHAKETVQQCVIAPFQYTQVFARGSMRTPPKGMLLYGPPGTGKTLLAKAIAKSCGAAFLEVKVESLFGKWLGESEQTVAAIFSLARKIQPCIVFVDELDSLLSSRSSGDAHAYANAKTIFLRHWDGFSTNEAKHKIVVIGATNCPEVLDAAVLRRLSVKIEVPYPEAPQRESILRILLKDEDVSCVDFAHVASRTHRYSGADLKELCQHACRMQAMRTIQSLPPPPPVVHPKPSFLGNVLGSLGFSFSLLDGAEAEVETEAEAKAPAHAQPLTTDLLMACMRVVKSNDNFTSSLMQQRLRDQREEAARRVGHGDRLD
eukprot:Rhum_TRINITY_DN19228_c0_g1::Rhum_TRINITY_DN19228_c0_g1_i1::g.169611::m.169611